MSAWLPGACLLPVAPLGCQPRAGARGRGRGVPASLRLHPCRWVSAEGGSLHCSPLSISSPGSPPTSSYALGFFTPSWRAVGSQSQALPGCCLQMPRHVLKESPLRPALRAWRSWQDRGCRLPASGPELRCAALRGPGCWAPWGCCSWCQKHAEAVCLCRGMVVAQSCPALCNPMDCSLPGSSVLEILQATILEWVAISFSRGSS